VDVVGASDDRDRHARAPAPRIEDRRPCRQRQILGGGKQRDRHDGAGKDEDGQTRAEAGQENF
jgi:hypothetical protein